MRKKFIFPKRENKRKGPKENPIKLPSVIKVRIKGSIPEERYASLLWENPNSETCAIKPFGYHRAIYNFPTGNIIQRNPKSGMSFEEQLLRPTILSSRNKKLIEGFNI